MIDITHISYSNDNNGLSKYNHEPLASARHIICSEIENTKMRNDFYRYLSWRIQTAPLKKKIMHRYKNFYVTCFTNESWVMIESFVGYAVEVFNNSHNIAPKLSVDSTIKVLKEWLDYDYDDYLWDEEEQEQEQEQHIADEKVVVKDKDYNIQRQVQDDILKQIHG